MQRDEKVTSSIFLEGLARKVRLPFATIAGLLVIGTCVWLNKSAWSTLVTVLGTLSGLVSVWMTLEIFKLGNQFTRNLEGLTRDVHKVSLSSAKLEHLQELRRNYWSRTGGEEAKIYWHFAWRFEAYDMLGLSLVNGGYVRIKVLGSNNPSLEYRLEQTQNPIYSVEIYEVNKTDDLEVGRAYCTCINGKLYIASQANEIELLSPLHQFNIVRLGDHQGGAVGIRPQCYRRLKDLEDLDNASQEV